MAVTDRTQQPRDTCPGCRRGIKRDRSGSLHAHKCPHGAWCAESAAPRDGCKRCAEERDGALVLCDEQAVGALRADAAKVHLRRAIGDTEAACRDICSVIGANDAYRMIAQATRALQDAYRTLDVAAADGALRLDRPPDDRDRSMHAGCGLYTTVEDPP